MRKWLSRAVRLSQGGGRRARRRQAVRLGLELLERREVLSTAILQTNLVSDISGLAQVTDPNLVNPWGLASGPGGPLWVADNGSGLSTLYNGQGVPQALVVTIPPPPSSPAGTLAAPTGTVFNGAGDFMVSDGTNSGSSLFLFATEDGTISGWSPGVDPTGQFSGPGGTSTNAVLKVDNSGNNFTEPDPLKQTGAVYKGLALGTDSGGRHLLFATNFRAGTIDVFNNQFQSTTVTGAFADASIPSDFAPFGIQNIDGHLFVTYAKQNAAKHDDVGGAGNGFVDEFTTDGVLVRHIAMGGTLNSPWGLVLAPGGFGDFSHDLLVGNFGDGHINAFDISSATPKFVGQLADGQGNPITIGGLWGLRFGNGGQAGSKQTLFFSAGINDEKDGLLGTLQVSSPIQFEQGGDDNAFLQTNLTSDVSGIAPNTDSHLVNAWGLAAGPNTAFWVSDNGTGFSTLYNGQGNPQKLVVTIPSVVPGQAGMPTGIVFNGNGGFDVSENGGTPGSSAFIFATAQGTIAGWNFNVDPNNAITVVNNSKAGASYTGLALAANGNQTLLYAANNNGGIDVFNSNFTQISLGSGAFTDPHALAGFTPYNIKTINGQLFVTYANGFQPGDGYIDVFNTDGTFAERFTTGGPLASPWGMTVAPAGFGRFGGDLLVGNVANGHIDAYNLTTRQFDGMLLDGRGNPIAINGLWGLSFGNGNAAGSTNTLFFTAGIGGYGHGLFGSIQAIDPIRVGDKAGPIPGSLARQVVGKAVDVAGDLGVVLFLNNLTGSVSDNMVQDVLNDFNTVEKQVASFSTPLAQLIVQAQKDVKTLVNDLQNGADLGTDLRHVGADLQTLDSVFTDLAHHQS
jgi:uncharacterized protein (TIGR03118 family)